MQFGVKGFMGAAKGQEVHHIWHCWQCDELGFDGVAHGDQVNTRDETALMVGRRMRNASMPGDSPLMDRHFNCINLARDHVNPGSLTSGSCIKGRFLDLSAWCTRCLQITLTLVTAKKLGQWELGFPRLLGIKEGPNCLFEPEASLSRSQKNQSVATWHWLASDTPCQQKGTTVGQHERLARQLAGDWQKLQAQVPGSLRTNERWWQSIG